MQNLLTIEDLGTNCNHFASKILSVDDFFLCESKMSEVIVLVMQYCSGFRQLLSEMLCL